MKEYTLSNSEFRRAALRALISVPILFALTIIYGILSSGPIVSGTKILTSLVEPASGLVLLFLICICLLALKHFRRNLRESRLRLSDDQITIADSIQNRTMRVSDIDKVIFYENERGEVLQIDLLESSHRLRIRGYSPMSEVAHGVTLLAQAEAIPVEQRALGSSVVRISFFWLGVSILVATIALVSKSIVNETAPGGTDILSLSIIVIMGIASVFSLRKNQPLTRLLKGVWFVGFIVVTILILLLVG